MSPSLEKCDNYLSMTETQSLNTPRPVQKPSQAVQKGRLLTRPTLVLPSSPIISQGWGLIDLPLRATFSPAHPLADIFHPPYPPIALQSISRDVPLSRARAFPSPPSLVKGVAKAALYCAHRTSTVPPCAFCEQEGRLATLFPSFGDRALREHRELSGPCLPLLLRRQLNCCRAPPAYERMPSTHRTVSFAIQASSSTATT